MTRPLSIRDLSGSRKIVFRVRPTVDESRQIHVNSKDIPGPAAGAVAIKNAPPSYSISGKIVARTTEEANQALKDIQTLRSWGYVSTDNSSQKVNVVVLDGYGSGSKVFNNIECVITNVGISFSDDVDYIKAGNGAEVPIITSFRISLVTNIEAKKGERFNLGTFLEGRLVGF